MASYAQRNKWYGWTNKSGGPTAGSVNGNIRANGKNIVIPFSEKLRANPLLSQFAATVGGSGATISAAAVDGNKLRLTMQNAMASAAAVVITYTQNATPSNRLADVFNDEVTSPTTWNFAAE